MAKADDLQRTSLILQEKPVGRLTLSIRRELNIGDLASDHYFLSVILLGMREKFGDLQKTGCVSKQWERKEGEYEEWKNQKPHGSFMLTRGPNVGSSRHDFGLYYTHIPHRAQSLITDVFLPLIG